MSTIAQKIAPQIPLRNCFKEVGGKVNVYVDFGAGAVYAIKDIFFAEAFC